MEAFQAYAARLDAEADGAELARAHCSIGNALRELGRYGHAEEAHAKNLKLVRGLRDLAGESAALGNLGNTLVCGGQFEGALEYHLEALAVACRVSSNRLVECSARNNLACVYLRLGEVCVRACAACACARTCARVCARACPYAWA